MSEPMTALEAVTSAHAAEAAPEALDHGASATPADATVPSGLPVEAGPPPATPGPIPFENHQRIIKNAREKARQEALAEWRATNGIPEDFNPADLRGLVETHRKYASQPLQGWQDYTAELLKHPEYGSQVRSLIARTLAQRGERTSEEPPPDYYVDNQDGTRTHFYSAAQLAKREEWLQGRMQSQFQQELGPIKEWALTAQQREILTKQHTEAAERATATYRYLSSLPGFEANRLAIRDAMAGDASLSAERAYLQVVLPTLSSKAQSDAVASLKAKALASTSDAGAQGAAEPKRPSNVKELAAFLEARSRT